VTGKPKLTDYAVVREVAGKLGATPAQVLIAWGAKRGYSVIPKSVQEERILSNFKQIELSDEDFKKISAIGHGNHTRFVAPFWPPPKFVTLWISSQIQHPAALQPCMGRECLRRAC
jgi:L-glyceraldehyde reductase